MADNTKVIQARLHVILSDGASELLGFTDELIQALQDRGAADGDGSPKDAPSRAFETLFRKATALEAAEEASKLWGQWQIMGGGACFGKFRAALAILGGSFREGQDKVIGSKALGDKQRVEDAVELLKDLKKLLGEFIEKKNGECGRESLPPSKIDVSA